MADRLRPEDTLSPQLLLHKNSERRRPSFKDRFHRFIYGTPNFALLAGDAGMALAQKVGVLLQKDIPANPPTFANGELRVIVPESVETRDIYVIQSTNTHPNRSLRQLKLLASGAKGRDANRIYNIFTQFPYARQDRIDQPGAPQGARQVAQEIFEASSHNPLKKPWQHETKLKAPGALLIVDIHATKPLEAVTRGSQDKYQWANLDSAYVLAPKIQEIITTNKLDVVIAFPDHGAQKRYPNYVQIFGNGQQPVVIDKERPVEKANVVRIADTQEDTTDKVKDKDLILIDDMIDTGGSILQTAKLFKSQGAKSVRVVATHGVFSNDALIKMSDPAIDSVIVTDSQTPTEAVLEHPKIEVVSLAPLLAEVIRRIENRESIGDLVKEMSPGFEKSYMKWGPRQKYRRRAAREIHQQLAA